MTNICNANDRDRSDFIVKDGSQRGRHTCKQVCCVLCKDRRGECQEDNAAVNSPGLRRRG